MKCRKCGKNANQHTFGYDGEVCTYDNDCSLYPDTVQDLFDLFEGEKE